MLEELRISNFAIIDQLELTFAPGLNVITGETGAGKSIIIDAVELLLGAKADPSFVRSGAEKAVIEATFTLNDQTAAALRPILQREDLIDDAPVTALSIYRELRSNGRSMSRINGTTVNQEVLNEVGALLVDVHGQSAHLSLLKRASHIDLLDRYANIMEWRHTLAHLVTQVNEVRREIKTLLEDEAALKRRADRLRSDIEEIDAAELVPGEDEELKAERNRLSNSEQLAKLTAEALTALYGEDSIGGQTGAVEQLMTVCALLGKLSGIDPAIKDDETLAEEAAAQADELAKSLRRYADSIEFSPGRLDEIEERLQTLNTMKKRYGGTIEAVIAYADKARVELENIENSEEHLKELREKETKLLKQVGDQASKISKARAAAAQKLAANIVTELADLRMSKTQFEVNIEQDDDPDEGCYVGDRRVAFDATGIDNVEFLMSANPGEPLRPLAKVASGGEAARIMLALKRVLSQADHTPTLIFDEIDQGIGGRVGTTVGEKLWALTREHQVMVVTHLAQLAGYADRHYRVMKLIDDGRTHTQIVALTQDFQRIEELAAMLGTLNESGYQSAKELIDQAADYKRTNGGNHGGGVMQPKLV